MKQTRTERKKKEGKHNSTIPRGDTHDKAGTCHKVQVKQRLCVVRRRLRRRRAAVAGRTRLRATTWVGGASTYVWSVVAHFLQVHVVDGAVDTLLLEELQRILLKRTNTWKLSWVKTNYFSTPLPRYTQALRTCWNKNQ